LGPNPAVHPYGQPHTQQAGYAAVAHAADGADCAVASGTVRRLHFGELRFTRLGLAMRGKWLRKVKNLQTAGVYPSLFIFISLSLPKSWTCSLP